MVIGSRRCCLNGIHSVGLATAQGHCESGQRFLRNPWSFDLDFFGLMPKAAFFHHIRPKWGARLVLRRHLLWGLVLEAKEIQFASRLCERPFSFWARFHQASRPFHSFSLPNLAQSQSIFQEHETNSYVPGPYALSFRRFWIRCWFEVTWS